MTLREFLAVFTVNDPVAGRALNTTTNGGVDSLGDLLTLSDPAGGRAIKITISGGVTKFWAEAYSATTQATSSWTAAGAATNINAAIVPKGTGAIVADIPDGTATGGNARGAYAVDLQMIRSAATQVASGVSSFVGGGENNTASGTAATIAAGTSNLSQVYKGFVGGGGTNTANAFGSVGGGFTNTANSNVALGSVSVTLTAGNTFVPGGFIGGNQSPVGALITGTGIPENTFLASTGPPNIIMSNAATSSGTVTITYWSPCGTVAGGRNNTASGIYSTVVGGQSNTASSNHTFIGGGSSNGVSGSFTDSYSLIVGGFGNGVSGNYDVLVGGRSNSISGTNNGNHRFIGGGSSNSIGEQSLYSIIVGGETNSIVGRNAFIGGGGAITMTGGNAYSVIGGGQSNTMSGGNTHMVIGGGFSNTASAGSSVVSGGSTNTASGVVSIITGGLQGVASLYGQQVHASGRFTANGDAQAHELIWRKEKIGTGFTTLSLDGGLTQAILPPTNCLWNGIISIAAICTDAGNGTTIVGDAHTENYTVNIKRIGTTTSGVGGSDTTLLSTNSDASMNDGGFTIGSNDASETLYITYTTPSTAGSTTKIRIVATFRGLQIQY